MYMQNASHTHRHREAEWPKAAAPPILLYVGCMVNFRYGGL